MLKFGILIHMVAESLIGFASLNRANSANSTIQLIVRHKLKNDKASPSTMPFTAHVILL